MRFINVHTHVFTFNHVPLKFIPFMNVILWIPKYAPDLLNKVSPEKLAAFLERGTRCDQLEILRELTDYYPSDACFAIHTIDFEYMEAGKCRKGYGFMEQLDEVARIVASPEWKERIFPFICVDPRRPDIAEIVKDYIENKGFCGVKLYPALGYYPQDERLDELWDWIEQKKIPVMVHCSKDGAVYNKKMGTQYCNRFSDPANFLSILEKHPDVKVCFAHFGGDKECIRFYKDGDNQKENWFACITQLIRKYKGVYADISYSGGNSDLMALFHVYAQDVYDVNKKSSYQIGDKMLFGSDYYMAHLSRNERWFSINIRSCMGETTFWKLMKNAEEYLWG